ncbi:MAG: paraquat-inducible protein A [Pseudomonadota bacterium]
MKLALALCLVGSAFSLGLGLVLPLVELKRLYFLTDTPSLLQIITGLWSDGSAPLALVVALFSVAFPLAKILAVTASALGSSGKVTRVLSALSKWSLLDVLLVAIVIFAAKTSGLATAITQPGVWFFAAATLLAAVASLLTGKR